MTSKRRGENVMVVVSVICGEQVRWRTKSPHPFGNTYVTITAQLLSSQRPWFRG